MKLKIPPNLQALRARPVGHEFLGRLFAHMVQLCRVFQVIRALQGGHGLLKMEKKNQKSKNSRKIFYKYFKKIEILLKFTNIKKNF